MTTPTNPAPHADGPFGMKAWQRRLALFGLWTVLGLLEAARQYIVFNLGQNEYTWAHTLTWGLMDWYLWGLFAIVIVRVTQKVGFERRHWPWNLLVHLLLAAAIGSVQIFLDALGYRLTELLFFMEFETMSWSIWRLYVFFLKTMGHTAIIIYFLIALGGYAINYYRRYRDAELTRARIQGQLAEAQLESLKTRLHPHFLFNTLNSISALIHSDPDAADQMTARLSELLRTAIEKAGVREVSLREELDFLQGYLDIQKIRYEDRLQFDSDVQSATLDATVPNLILQPLVENAIRHGVSKRTEPVHIQISARLVDKHLSLEVRDNGPGVLGGAAGIKEGFGLRSTRERLQQMYGSDHEFTLTSEAGQGTKVDIRLPLRLIEEKEDLKETTHE